MVVREQEFTGRRGHAGLVAVLAAAAAAALWFIGTKLALYGSYDPAAYDDLWPRRFGFVPHMAGGIVAILVGVAQLWLGLTGRTGGLHRVLGRIYVGAVAVGAAGGFYLAFTIQYGGFAYAAGLTSLAVAWVLTTGMAVFAIRRRAVTQHREWMIRSYVVTFAFVIFRVLDHLLNGWKVAPVPEVDTFAAFACWAIPLMLAEPLIQLRKLRPGG